MSAAGDLTPRELEVLALVAEGHSLAQVGDVLTLSRCTVKNHCANVHRKLGVHSTLEAIVIAVREGALLPPALTTTAQEGTA